MTSTTLHKLSEAEGEISSSFVGVPAEHTQTIVNMTNTVNY